MISKDVFDLISGYGLEGLAGSGYGLDSALGSFDLGLSGLGPLYGLNYGSRSGFNNYGLGMMDGLANNYGIDSGYGGDSTAALLSQYAMLSGSPPGLGSVLSPLYGHSSPYGIGFGSTLNPYELWNGYGSYGNDYNRGMGVYQSGIYPYSQKEKKSPSVRSSGREAKRTFTRLFGVREH